MTALLGLLAVDSWVGPGSNRAVIPSDLEKALAPDVLDASVEHTGLPRDGLRTRPSRELPRAVDQDTPHGRLPDDEGMRSWPA